MIKQVNGYISMDTDPPHEGVYQMLKATGGVVYSQWRYGQWHSTSNTVALAGLERRSEDCYSSRIIGWKLIETPAPEGEIVHKEMIKLVIRDGASIQWYCEAYKDMPDSKGWLTFKTPREAVHALVSFPERKYRVKPELLVKWAVVYHSHNLKPILIGCESEQDARNMKLDHDERKIMRMEFNPETLELINAATENP